MATMAAFSLPVVLERNLGLVEEEEGGCVVFSQACRVIQARCRRAVVKVRVNRGVQRSMGQQWRPGKRRPDGKHTIDALVTLFALN